MKFLLKLVVAPAIITGVGKCIEVVAFDEVASVLIGCTSKPFLMVIHLSLSLIYLALQEIPKLEEKIRSLLLSQLVMLEMKPGSRLGDFIATSIRLVFLPQSLMQSLGILLPQAEEEGVAEWLLAEESRPIKRVKVDRIRL